MVKIEVITIGDEILSGNILDTNFAWIADRLWSAGFDLHRHMTVGDELGSIGEALLAAAGRSNAVIVTGGLGPTLDDITIESAAKAFSLPLVLNMEAKGEIETFFRRIGREMTPNNLKQAMLPQGSAIIPNRVGTAPGCRLTYRRAEFFFLPGVPAEMKPQFGEHILPRLLQKGEGGFRQIVLRCFGAPEAEMAQKLEGIDLAGVDLAYRLSFPEVLIKVSARGADTASIERRIGEVSSEIKGCLGDLVYGEGEEGLPAVVGRLLAERGERLSVAESCTGGCLANLITDVPGSSRCFERGVITYSNESKRELLGVAEPIIKTFGAVSAETAVAMAKGIRRISGTDYGLAITGIAGPGGGTPEKPPGTVHIALDSASGVEEREFHFPLSRDWFKRLASFMALEMLRRKLYRTS